MTDEQRHAIEWAIGMASQHNIHRGPLRALLAGAEPVAQVSIKEGFIIGGINYGLPDGKHELFAAPSAPSVADAAGAMPIYQVKSMALPDVWLDVDKNDWDAKLGMKRRIVYAAPPSPSVADAASDAWSSARDAAIKACALMIKGICMTKSQDQWTALIEKRIRFMLKESK